METQRKQMNFHESKVKSFVLKCTFSKHTNLNWLAPSFIAARSVDRADDY